MARILDRYILREVIANCAVVTGVLLIILLTNEVARVLSRAADSQYPRSMVLELIGLGAIHNLNILVPIGLLLGVVFAFGRLYHDSEMAAALACGVSPRRIYTPVIAFAVVVTLLLTWLSIDVAPESMGSVLTLRNAAVRAGQFATVAPGRFHSFGAGSAIQLDLNKFIRLVRASGYRGYLPIETLSSAGEEYDPKVRVRQLLKELREAIRQAE